MTQSCTTRITHHDAITVLHLHGELDLLGTQELGKELEQACEAARRGVVADLTGLTFLSSSGLSQLLRLADVCARRKVELRVLAPTRVIYRPLQITGLDQQLTVLTSTLDEALASLDPAATATTADAVAG
ncbi:STAS domain-containing protein [Saccharomonospora piscinae]|uniref:STAS domain-containing protein n=1 Tax=Saccharomonospora piscinae TaxID=687388 RepID=UPI00046592AC|nr:STAS domain-containing protein [Saccharomonospora piscinae]